MGGGHQKTTAPEKQCTAEKTKSVLHLLPPLKSRQAKFCDESCLERFLKCNGDNVKKAVKQIKSTLIWRHSFDVDNLTADEFCAELAFGVAFVAGRDNANRPVLVVRLKPEQFANNTSKKHFLRFLVFTMEVANAMMTSALDQCVFVLDAGCLKKGGMGFSLLTQLLKIICDYYPARLAKFFIVDAPSVFYYLWKGIGSFVSDNRMKEKVQFVYSRNYAIPASAARHLIRALRSYSNCNLLLESQAQGGNIDDYSHHDRDQLNIEEDPQLGINFSAAKRSTSEEGREELEEGANSSSLTSLLPMDRQEARSLSFVIPPTTTQDHLLHGVREFQSFRIYSSSSTTTSSTTTTLRSAISNSSSSAISGQEYKIGTSRKRGKLMSWGGEATGNANHRHRSSSTNYDESSLSRMAQDQNGNAIDPFVAYVGFYNASYDEPAYRAMMKPPLGGLVSLLSPELKRKPCFYSN